MEQSDRICICTPHAHPDRKAAAAMTPRIYLAGPSVFMPDWRIRRDAMQAACAARGAVGLYPLDSAVQPTPSKFATGVRIFQANRALIDSSAAVIADLSPFRGPSADPGTVWELAYAFGRDKVVAGFTTDLCPYHERVTHDRDFRDAAGFTVEDFDMTDNLMIAGCLASSNSSVYLTFEDALDRVLYNLSQKA
jgi:nucleoside 2-deoxyribosyltransferase